MVQATIPFMMSAGLSTCRTCAHDLEPPFVYSRGIKDTEVASVATSANLTPLDLVDVGYEGARLAVVSAASFKYSVGGHNPIF